MNAVLERPSSARLRRPAPSNQTTVYRALVLDILNQLDLPILERHLKRIGRAGPLKRRRLMSDFQFLAFSYMVAAQQAPNDGIRAGYLARSHAVHACVALLEEEARTASEHVRKANALWQAHRKWIATIER
jgi:hypothetical protein